MNYRSPACTLAVALLLSMALWVGCDSSDSSNSLGPLIPLEEGNTYSFETTDGFINQLDFRVAGNTTINGTTYRKVEIIATGSNGATFSRTYVARERESGLYVSPSEDNESLIGFELQTSVSAGDTYIHTDEDGNSFVVSVSEQSTTVETGTFEVLVYRIVNQANGNTDVAYIAPGIGPVQLDFRGETYRLVSTNVQ